MIRRSAAIATVAILLSLLVHFVGLNFTPRIQPERSGEDATNDVVALGNAFEDVAENLSEPVPPEKTPPPEPSTETVPEPEFADTPTSEALVASANPQHTTSPDTGSGQVVQPDTTEPSELDEGRIPEPETVEPSGGDQGTAVDVAVTPPVEPGAVVEAPKGNPDAGVEPVEAVIAEPVAAELVLRPPVAPVPKPDAPQRLAALPVPVTPALPVTPVPESSTVPVIPLGRETLAPETPETAVEPAPEEAETVRAEDESDGSDLAIAASPRPQLPTRQTSAEPKGLSNGSTEFSELLFPRLIESPLTANPGGQTDLIVGQNGIALSGGFGFLDSRNSGNFGVTNYVGRVLIHLNSAAAVRVSAQGYARVLFEINADGTLARVDVIDSSGSQAIDGAAKAQVRSAAPFPRPPQGTSRILTFVYRSN